jgi:predicted nucleic acid-binding protein
MKPRIYLETTIPSYLTARPTRDLFVAARQQSTREWWEQRHGYELFISQVVILECQAGDPGAAAARLEVLAGLPLLDEIAEAKALASKLAENLGLPKRAMADAVHIATAAVYGIDYLLTWNCRHIANATLRRRIQSICNDEGFDSPIICTSDQLLGGETDD